MYEKYAIEQIVDALLCLDSYEVEDAIAEGDGEALENMLISILNE